jgi:hypothetical protein
VAFSCGPIFGVVTTEPGPLDVGISEAPRIMAKAVGPVLILRE